MTRPPGKKIGQLMLERGLLTEAQLTQTLSLQLGIPWVSLVHIDFSRQLLSRVPHLVAERHCLIPIFVRHVKKQGDTLYVAIEDPKNEAALAEVSQVANLPTRPMIASPTDIMNAIRLYYGDGVSDVPPPMTRPEPPPVPMRKPPPSEERFVAPPPVPPPVPSSPSLAVATTSSDEAPLSVEPPSVEPMSEPPETVTSTSDSPTADPQLEVKLITLPPPKGSPVSPAAMKRRAKIVALTLLDGTKVQLPSREPPVEEPRGKSIPPSEGGVAETLTGRDFIAALRAAAHGADPTEVLGGPPQWEAVVAALLNVLMKKGLLTDWEFIEEYKKI